MRMKKNGNVEELLKKKATTLRDQIKNKGDEIAGIASAITREGSFTSTPGQISDARQIFDSVQDIEELVIELKNQSKALCDLENDLFDTNKKVITGVQFGRSLR